MIGSVQDQCMNLLRLRRPYSGNRRADGLHATGFALLSVVAVIVAYPLLARNKAVPEEAVGGTRLSRKYDPVSLHLHALSTGTITGSLAYVDENAVILSAKAGGEPRQIAAGRRSLLPLYILSFGVEPSSVSSYQCAERADSVYCTFTLRNAIDRTAFGFEFWVAEGKISRVMKLYEDR